MAKKTGLLGRFFSGNGKQTGPSRDRRRRLAFESLESRTMLSFSITANVCLDAAGGTPVRNACVLFGAFYVDTANPGTRQIDTARIFTNGSGAITYTDTDASHQLVAGTGEIYLKVNAVAPSFAANDPNDLTPRYAVLPDRGSQAKDTAEAATPSKWRSDSFEEEFFIPLTAQQVANPNNVNVNAVISRAPGGGVYAIGGEPDLVRGRVCRLYDSGHVLDFCR